jgi:hypothetical protein
MAGTTGLEPAASAVTEWELQLLRINEMVRVRREGA